MTTRTFLTLASAAVLSLSSCYYDVESELYPGTTCDLSNTTWSATVEPIISTNCSVPGCHVAGAVFPDLSTYAGVSENIAAVEQRALVAKTMPPSGPLSSCDQEKLRAWIDAGAQNN